MSTNSLNTRSKDEIYSQKSIQEGDVLEDPLNSGRNARLENFQKEHREFLEEQKKKREAELKDLEIIKELKKTGQF